jgi:8-oxo-dGTP pyrophosphatase MutT (NUDIX family)
MDIDDINSKNNENNEKKIFCMNCGKIGHISKKCLCPIISIGIICIKININNIDFNSIINYSKKIQNNYLFSSDELIKLKNLYKKIEVINNDTFDDYIQYLLIRRKNSLNYVEFIRGKYDISNIDYLQRSLNFITENERNMIRNNSYDYLWKNLWGEDLTNNNNIEFIESKQKFNLLKKGAYIKKNDINMLFSFETLINNTFYNFKEPEWGFPKGRRNIKEKNIECAKREFGEETALNEDMYNILNISPLEESYMASNNLKYKHIYYVSQIKNKDTELIIDKNNKLQNIEISDIQWFNYKDGLNIIREYNVEKKNILLNLHFTLRYTIENFKNITESFIKINNL